MNEIVTWGINTVLDLFYLFVLHICFCTFMEKRYKHKSIYVFSWLLYGLATNIIFKFYNNPTITIISNSILLFVVGCTVFKRSIRSIILTIVFIDIFGMIADLISLYSVSLIWNSNIEDILSNKNMFLMCTVLSKFLIFMISRIALGTRRDRRGKQPYSYWMGIIIVVFGSMVIVYNIFTSHMVSILMLITISVLTLMNIFVFYIYDRLIENLELKMRCVVFEQKIESYERQYEEIEFAQMATRRLRHDMLNHFTIINGYAYAGDVDEIKNYIESVVSEVQKRKRLNVASSGNIEIDSIINHKISIADEKRVTFHVFLDIPSDLKMNPSDICGILGNALDNAMEACSYLENPEERYINLDIAYSVGLLHIKVENSYDGKIFKLENNSYVTRKEDKELHGFGLQIINDIVNKNKGEMNIFYNEKLFRLNIFLFADV